MAEIRSKAELRKFAWIMAGGFAFLGTIAYLRGRNVTAIVLLSLSALFCLCGVFAPLRLRLVYKYWMQFAFILGWINTRILLGLFFFVVVTPVSILMKLFRRDVLMRKLDRSKKTYWNDRPKTERPRERYERLF
jgi:hypothetical protein